MNEEPSGNVLIYQGKNGTRVELKSSDGYDTILATQKQMAMLFDVEIPAIIKHIKHIYETAELKENQTTSILEVVQFEGEKEVKRAIKHYNLDMIIAVGYRVNSAKATQFRIWATKILKEYIVKGFAMDDERLKDPKTNQYFKELLERVKEIRASEKLFYQQVRDVYATAIDYEEKKQHEDVILFFKTVQNKLIYSITNKTAAELVAERHNTNDGNFGLTSWEGSIVRKKDILSSKNYLTQKELKALNALVNSLLDYLERQTEMEKAITLKDWEIYTDKLISFNEYPVLQNGGTISHDKMQKITESDYEIFDNNRKKIIKKEAEKEAIEDLKVIEKEVKEILKRNKTNLK